MTKKEKLFDDNSDVLKVILERCCPTKEEFTDTKQRQKYRKAIWNKKDRKFPNGIEYCAGVTNDQDISLDQTEVFFVQLMLHKQNEVIKNEVINGLAEIMRAGVPIIKDKNRFVFTFTGDNICDNEFISEMNKHIKIICAYALLTLKL